MKLTTKFIVVVACAMLGIPVLFFFYSYLSIVYHRIDWKQRTTPLPSETVAQLCANFGLEKDASLCKGKRDVYGPDFYEIIRDTFRPYEAYEIPSSEAATYEDVEETIGIFKYECDDVATTGDGFSFYSCRYDLRGDREFIIGIIYTSPDNAVFRINTPMGFDGE
jgi:hypothetical protein